MGKLTERLPTHLLSIPGTGLVNSLAMQLSLIPGYLNLNKNCICRGITYKAEKKKKNQTIGDCFKNYGTAI